ncbi:MAG TPA: ligase-associated DNA damage response exonuclease [Anaerolineaceae bacterium]|nr:ligase-associated DNA damage response exonuclease [Anaerolineaceae bacterium]
MSANTLLHPSGQGLYCPAGDFYIDPWEPVPRAIVTHAHGDHLRPGSGAYLAARPGEAIARARLYEYAGSLRTVPYGEEVWVNGVKVSLHPAGHILGSAQVRVEYHGEVWVVSGDYKLQPDPTCAPFEPLHCDTFITEATFGLPIYRWPAAESVFAEINAWWRENQAAGRASVLYAYVLGKAQRVLAGVDASIGPLFTHGAVERINALYRSLGVELPSTRLVTSASRSELAQGLTIAPISVRATPWFRRFGEHSSAFASGWMRIRGARRRQAVDRGFILSDHVDWPDLNRAVRLTGARRVWVTHGYTNVVARWLEEKGLESQPLETRYTGEVGEPEIENE